MNALNLAASLEKRDTVFSRTGSEYALYLQKGSKKQVIATWVDRPSEDEIKTLLKAVSLGIQFSNKLITIPDYVEIDISSIKKHL